MRLARTLLALLPLVLLAGAVHAAQGVNLRWDQCYGDAGARNKSFACDTNSGSETLVASFVVGTSMSAVTGTEVVIEMAASAPVLPLWWSLFDVGTCRIHSLGVSLTLEVGAVYCVDWASGTAGGGIGAYNIGNRGPNTARIVIATATPGVGPLPTLIAGQEYFSCKVTIDHAKTIGADVCAGCTVPLCIVFKSLNVTTAIPVNNRLLTGPANGVDSDFATWQGGGNPMVGGATGCPAATPTRRSNWGEVKALYH